MKLYYEIDFEEFAYDRCWSGARDTIDELTVDEVKILGEYIEEMIDSEMDETELNDFLWFERDTIAKWLGYEDFDDLLKKHKESEEE